MQNSMQNMNKKILNATKWSMMAEVAAKLISPIINIVLARLLLPEDFGAVATITMVISFAEIFSDAGFQKYVVQHKFSEQSDFDKSVNVAFWSNLILSVLIVAVIFLFQKPLAQAVGSPELHTGMVAASLSIVFVGFSSVQTAVYRRNLDFKTLFHVRMVVSLIPLLITVPLALLFKNYWALVIGGISKDFVCAVILTIKSSWKPRFYYSFDKLKEMLSFSLWTLFETMAIWLTSNIGIFIIGRSLSSYYLGLYKTSMTTVNSYMSIILSAVVPVLFSALSRYQDDDETFKTTFYTFQKSVAIFLLPMGVGIFFFRDLIVTILLGSAWSEAADFVGLWGVVYATSVVLGNLYSEVYRSKGKPKISLLIQLVHMFFLIPVLLLSVSYGFKVVFISRSAVIIQYIITTMLVAQCLFGIRITTTLKNIFPQVFSSILMGCVAVVLKNIHTSMLWQIASVFICIIVYFSIIMLFPGMRKMVLDLDFVKSFTNKLRSPHDDKL